jgi:large conductance mechanosensitive channel
MNKNIRGFMDFVREQGIVGLAVGLAIGVQVGQTVGAIVDGLINPFVSFILGSGTSLENAVWNIIGVDTIKTDYWFTLGDRYLVLGWGKVVSSLIVLVAVAAVIYYVVHGLKLDKLDKKSEKSDDK